MKQYLSLALAGTRPIRLHIISRAGSAWKARGKLQRTCQWLTFSKFYLQPIAKAWSSRVAATPCLAQVTAVTLVSETSITVPTATQCTAQELEVRMDGSAYGKTIGRIQNKWPTTRSLSVTPSDTAGFLVDQKKCAAFIFKTKAFQNAVYFQQNRYFFFPQEKMPINKIRGTD